METNVCSRIKLYSTFCASCYFRHYEALAIDAPLTYKGVVFNEMKGVYSSPDSVNARRCFKELFPDTTYGVDSGGDPAAIVELTWCVWC